MEIKNYKNINVSIMIKAIVFDLGGVLFNEGKSVASEKLAKKYNYDKEVIFKILTSPESKDLRKGLISDKEFWDWTRNNLPEGYDAYLIKKEWYEGYLLDNDIFNLIKRLKGKYKLVAFSGNIKSRVEFLDKKYDFRKYFDIEIYSFDYHLNKPDKRFIEVMVKKTNLKPEEIVYIDDSEEYVLLAKKMDLNALIYSQGRIKRLKKELKELGVKFPNFF